MEKNNNINLIDVDSVAHPESIITKDGKPIGYTMNYDDKEKMDYIELIINDDQYPLDTLPKEIQELVRAGRESKKHHR